MMRRAYLSLMAFNLLGVGCSEPAKVDVWQAPTIATVDEFQNRVATEDFILHIDVDWSGTAAQSRKVVAEFASALANDSGLRSIVVRRVDCTEPTDLCKELHSFVQFRHLINGGYGALVWVRSGKVVDFTRSAHEANVADLLARTHKAFQQQQADD